jgi:hypothetical protein
VQGGADVARIGDEQDERLDAGVAELQMDPAMLRLHVGETREGLDGDLAAVRERAEHRVEGSLVAELRQRHLVAQHQ